MADPVLPSGVPAEFRLYLSGAIKWHRGEHAAARKDWRALLALSADQRQWRSTWAAFMLAKSAETPADRIAGYRHVRELAAEGFKDSLGLAATSLGDEAAVELYECRQPAKALRLYLQQVHTGERWADVSLAMTASRVLSNNHKELAALVKDKVVLDVLTAYCASTGHYGVLRWSWNSDERTIAKSKTRSNLHALLKAIEVAGIERVAHAGEIAWGAYRLGDYETAAAWAKRAGKDPRGTWIRAKLLLREGKQADAAEALARVVKTFPCNEVWTCPDNSARTPGDRGLMSPRSRAAGELAVLKLCRQQYVDALDLLARHGWWADAAFVAERVLTADELKAYVQTAWPEMVTSPDRWKDLSEDHARRKARTARNLRHLLARRLTRIGRWKEARPFYPPKHRETLDAYIQAIRRGHDSSLTNAERAEQFMTAARMARSKGKVLLATE
ncbi:MAG: hypothetical protein KGY81_10825, partial [Phycisphaerae bacterium]|nr:hypothetical protein [Phycisphaerae bacterium]